jgi:hypothetical protein
MSENVSRFSVGVIIDRLAYGVKTLNRVEV